MCERLDIREAEAHEIRQLQRARARDVAQRVAAHVAVIGGIGQLADAHAIEHDPDHPVKMRCVCLHSATLPSSSGVSVGNFNVSVRGALHGREPEILVHLSD